MERLNEGIKLLKEDNLEEAIQIFDEILEGDSTNEVALLNKGIALFEDDRFEEALEVLDTLLAIDEKNVEALFYKGNVLANNEEVKDNKKLAIESYTKAIEIDPKHISSLMNRGIEHLNLNDFSKAIVDFDKIVAIDPKNKVAYLNYGNVFKKASRFDDALRLYNKALEIDKEFINAYIERGSVYHTQKDLVSAENDINKVLSLNPNHLKGLLNKGRLLLSFNKRDEAEKIFNDLLKKHPNNVEVLFMQAYLSQVDKQYETAVTFYGKILQQDPQHLLSHHNLSKIFYNIKDMNRAFMHIQTAIKINPAAVVLYVDRGNIYMVSGRADLAYEDYNKVVETLKDNKEVIEKRARAAVLAKKFDIAFETYEKFHEEEPERAVWLYTLGWTHLQKGENDKALEFFNKALEKEADFIPAISDRGIAYSNMQMIEEGRADFERVIELAPKTMENYLNLANLLGSNKKFEEALDVLERGIKANENDPRPYMLKGNLYRTMEEFEKSIDVYTDVLDITNDRHIDAYLARAFSYKKLEKFTEALEDFSAAINLQPKNPILLFNRSRCLYEMKEYTRAISDLNKALEINPNIINLYEERAKNHEALGNKEMAEADNNKVEELRQLQEK